MVHEYKIASVLPFIQPTKEAELLTNISVTDDLSELVISFALKH